MSSNVDNLEIENKKTQNKLDALQQWKDEKERVYFPEYVECYIHLASRTDGDFYITQNSWGCHEKRGTHTNTDSDRRKFALSHLKDNTY